MVEIMSCEGIVMIIRFVMNRHSLIGEIVPSHHYYAVFSVSEYGVGWF